MEQQPTAGTFCLVSSLSQLFFAVVVRCWFLLPVGQKMEARVEFVHSQQPAGWGLNYSGMVQLDRAPGTIPSDVTLNGKSLKHLNVSRRAFLFFLIRLRLSRDV